MGKIGIVTDSTCDFEPNWYKKNDVLMVPLSVRFGEEIFRDWLDIRPAEFYKRLQSERVLPKTSQPSVADFDAAYKKLAVTCDHIISVHLSSKLSGTIASAEIAAKNAEVPVTLIDGKQASLATGLIVSELAVARTRGASITELKSLANDIIRTMRVFFYVDTLKFLEKGGRLGKASALVGLLLNIKVVLTLDDGEVAPAAKLRGRKKVFKAITAMVKEAAPSKNASFGFAHGAAPDSLKLIKDELRAVGFNIEGAPDRVIGAVIGTYTGPGAFAVVVY
ncbi:MAG TPA: DegV family protein [Actinobacteria bacterium]|nr:DegV family protein [Actinomycetes bacterium]HEX21277.1 DegV family protein [Actinomycetota bacterium]